MGSSNSRRLGRLARAPLRALTRVCDLYVRSVMSCAAAHPHYSAAMAYPAAITPLPASFRSGRGGGGGGGRDDLKELIRVASVAHVRAAPQPRPAVRKSQSVAICRIDEDEPCDFGSSDGLHRRGGSRMHR